MSPILCIGESRAEYEGGLAKAVCATQVRAGPYSYAGGRAQVPFIMTSCTPVRGYGPI